MPRVGIVIAGDPRSAVKAFRTTRSEAALLDRQLARTGRGVDRFGRGVVAGSGVLGGLGRSVAFASSTFLGGAGLIYAFRKVTDEARNAQAIQTRTAQAVRRAGLEWRAYRKEILRTVEVQSRKSSFDDEKLLDQMGFLITRTRDVRKATDLLSIATNVARGRNMSLEASGRLVLKASIGQAGALRRLGINIKQGATATQILTALQKRYSGQAERFARTSAGAQERFNKTLQDSEEIIGRALLPTIDKLVRRGTEWLDKQNRSGQLQKIVNQNLRDAKEILGGVADALRLIKTATEPVVDAVGGIGNAVTALTTLWIGMKIKALIGFGATATASSVTASKVIADAAKMELALDAATRPRVVPITLTGLPGRIGPYGTGKVPKAPTGRPPAPSGGGFLSKLGRFGKGVGALLATGAAAAGGWKAMTAAYGYTLPTAVIIAILASAGAGSRKGDRSSKYPRVYKAVAMAANGTASPQELSILRTQLGPYSLENAPDSAMARAERDLRALNASGSTRRPHGSGGRPPSATKGPGGGSGAPAKRTIGDIQTDIYRAQAAGNEGLELHYLRELKAAYQRARRSLEHRGELSQKEKDQYDNILQQIASTNAQIDSITQKGVKEVAASKKKANDAEKKAAQAAKDAADKLADQWQASRQQASQAFAPLFGGPTLGQGLGDFFREFGAMGVKLDPRLILQDIRQQNAQSAALIKNLQIVAKRGAPVGLMNELRAMGPEGAAFAASLANAPQKIFDAIVTAFKQREAQLKQATIFIQARNVVVRTGDTTGGLPGQRGPAEIRRAGGGMVPGTGVGDTVPAMLTPGEMVLNRMQQGGLARALGMGGASPQHLFGAISRFAGGGVAGKPLDPPFGMTRHGPRQYSVYGSRGAFAPMRPHIGSWLKQFYGHGLSPAAGKNIGSWWTGHFSEIAKGYSRGGVVSRLTQMARDKGWSDGRIRRFISQLSDDDFKKLDWVFGHKPGLMDRIGSAIGKYSGAKQLVSDAWWSITHPKDRLLERGRAANGQMVVAYGPTGGFLRAAGAGKIAGVGAARAGRVFDEVVARRMARQMFATMDPEHLPPGIKGPGDIVKLMRRLHGDAVMGKSARFWYTQSGKELLAYTHGNKMEARKVALLAALYSPRVSVEESIRRAARAWQEYQDTGGKSVPTKGVFDYQPDQAMAILSGKMTALNGRKVNNFFLDLMTGIDPRYARRHRRPGGSTVDVWMQKAFGYSGEAAPKSAEYTFMEDVVAKIAKDLGWTPNQAQAAIWTTTKARAEARPIGRAGLNLGDFMARQATQINYEAAWGRLGKQIKSTLGEDAARRYAEQKFNLLRGSRGQSLVLEQLGLLGKRGGGQQGVWGIDVNPGFHDLVLAPRFPESKKNFRMLPRFERDVREAAAVIGYVLRQQGVGTLAEFPMQTAAGTVNANVRAGANSAWLARKFSDSELAAVSKKLGTRMLMLPRRGGWVIKPASNSQKAKAIMQSIGSKLEGMELAPANVRTGYVDSSEYMKLIDRAEKKHPGTLALARSLRKRSEDIDAIWAREVRRAREGRMLHAAGGALVPGRGNRDTVPAMLTPGELVLNRKQQGGLARVLGLGRVSGQKLFSEIQGFAGGGVLASRTRQATSFLPGSSSGMQPAATFQQHNTITVPPQFADTEWAIERGLQRATWRLKKGI